MEKSMDSYDNFDDIIEYDADGSSEKENEETPNLIFIKQPKTTKDQFNKIASFVNGMNKSTSSVNCVWLLCVMFRTHWSADRPQHIQSVMGKFGC